MMPSRYFWISSCVALVLLSGGIVVKPRLLQGADLTAPEAAPAGTITAPTIPGLPTRADEAAHQAKIKAWPEQLRQARAAGKMPDVNALLAIADANDDKTLRDAVNAMTPDQCLWVFQRLVLSDPSPSSPSWSMGYGLALGAVLEPLLSHGIKGQAEAIARWLLDPKNHFPDPQEAQGLASEAIAAWGRTDARAAADFAASLPPDADDRSSLPRVLTTACSAWGYNDPRAALAWAKTLPDADVHKVYALEGVFSGLNEAQPEEAKACLERLVGVNKEAPELAADVAGMLAQREIPAPQRPQAALQWALSLPGLPEREAALKTVVDVWAPCSADCLSQAAQWATSLPPDETRGTVWGEVALNRTAFDGPSRGFAGGSPEFFERMRINGKAADDWLRTLPTGVDRDKAMAIRDQWEDSLRKRMIWR